MTNIKISGLLIFIISILLVLLTSHISAQNKAKNDILHNISMKKDFTQDISKNIFYIYKHRPTSTKQLDESIKKFLDYINNEYNTQEMQDLYDTLESDKILALWNKFYLLVQKFRDNTKVTTTYSNILLEKIVNDIYTINLDLILEFDKLMIEQEKAFQESIKTYRYIQYTLFSILILLLIYLFTQVKTIIAFIQKFLIISKNIITNSSIKELEPLEVQNEDKDISQAKNNFNYLVQNIDTSIQNASKSIEHSHQSLEILEQNIQELLEFIYIMDENKPIDKELTKKEDILIQSLEELTNSSEKLSNVQKDLQNLLLEYKNR